MGKKLSIEEKIMRLLAKTRYMARAELAAKLGVEPKALPLNELRSTGHIIRVGQARASRYCLSLSEMNSRGVSP